MMSETLELGSHKPLETKLVCKNYTPKSPHDTSEALIARLHSLHVKICSSVTLVPISHSDPKQPMLPHLRQVFCDCCSLLD